MLCVLFLSYPELKPVQSINAHPSNCICIKFDPMGKYFATGSADALVSLWDVDELVCVRCFSRCVTDGLFLWEINLSSFIWG
jgi:THO complex subunit 3